MGRLAQGNMHGVKSIDTIDFISGKDVTSDQKVTYASFVCDYKPLKDESYRIGLVVGGNKLSYDQDTGAPAVSLLETKILLNSVISGIKHVARFISCDLKDFFLGTPMEKT